MESVRLEPRLGLVADPIVTKEYREDLGEQDDQGYYDYAYRYGRTSLTSTAATTQRGSTRIRPRKRMSWERTERATLSTRTTFERSGHICIERRQSARSSRLAGAVPSSRHWSSTRAGDRAPAQQHGPAFRNDAR